MASEGRGKLGKNSIQKHMVEIISRIREGLIVSNATEIFWQDRSHC